MHLYMISRGIKQNRDIWVSFMQSQFFKWTRKNLKTGKDEVSFVQGALRPIELWEYVFPEECLNEVLTNLKLSSIEAHKNGRNWKDKTALTALRKMLQAEELPADFKAGDVTRVMTVDGVPVHIIGIKKDGRDKWDAAGYEQEML
jgi:hypothetical protein